MAPSCVPVVLEDGTLAGVLALNDSILRAPDGISADVLAVLKAICEHRHEPVPA